MLRALVATTVTTGLLLGALQAPATADDETVTYSGQVLTAFGGSTVAHIHVSWYVPATGAYGSVETEPNGLYSLPVPTGTTDWYLLANVELRPSGVYPGNYEYSYAFVGAGGAEDFLWQTLDPLPPAVEDATLDAHLRRDGELRAGALQDLGAESSYELWKAGGSERPLRTSRPWGEQDYQTWPMTPGRYRVLLRPRDGVHLDTFSDVVDVIDDIEVGTGIDLRVGATVTGRLLASGKPKSGLQVRVQGEHGTWSATTDANGRYRVRGLPTGTYRVSEQRLDNGWSTGTALVAATEGRTTTRDLTLVREGALAVSGPGAVVVATTEGRRVREVTGTRVTLPPGTYDVYASDRTRYASKRVTVRAGKTTDAGRLRLDRLTVTAYGDIRSADQTGRKRATVCDLLCDGTDPLSVIGDENGQFTVPGVIPHLPATITAQQVGWVPVSVEAKPARSVHTPIRLTQRMATLRGRVQFRGVPVAGTVELVQKGTVVASRTLDDGAFTFGTRETLPGTYRLRLDADPSILTGQPFWYDLPPGLTKLTLAPGDVRDLGAVEVTVGR